MEVFSGAAIRRNFAMLAFFGSGNSPDFLKVLGMNDFIEMAK